MTPPDPSRNHPCPCGSGKKFKRCHGSGGPIPPNVLAAARQALPLLRAQEAKEADRVARHGEGRPLIHAEFEGNKVVAVGPMLSLQKEWNTFPDFLSDHIIQVLGEEWFKIEVARPAAERHPVMAYRWGHYEETRKLSKGPDGLIASVLTGHFAALLTLAYDLFVLQHNSAFHDDIVDRLRHRDQFAGARYELFAAATCVRAGMTVRHEDERDRRRRHVEFIATHPDLGIDIAVEAKQRQRMAGRPALPGTTRPDVTSLVNAAMKKRPGMPFIVFVDLDMDPPPVADPGWIGRIEGEIRKEMERVEANGGGALPANAILVTNIAYGRAGAAPAPNMMIYVHSPKDCEHPLADEVPFKLFEAALKHRNIPNDRLGASPT